ncbi:MAG: hypothetical protein ACK5W9_06895 [Bdellovibrionales bacterium]
MSLKSTLEKAQEVNLDIEKYGTFAEIGAGQEVARHFFTAGKASQTIAKTISAYDMIYSDEIYGKEKSGRYVVKSRLIKMLDKEYNLMLRRLESHRGSKTAFFSFANTVATGSAETPKCHGWMGIRFQTKPGGPPHDIILHVRMMDRFRLQQQESLGVIGTNLIHSAFYHRQNHEKFVHHLVDNLKKGQILIDYFEASGPDLAHFDNRLVNLLLVKMGLSEAVLFGPDQKPQVIADEVFQKALLIQRGHYRPMTTSHLDMMDKGLEQLKLDIKSLKLKSHDVVTFNEIEISNTSDLDDVLARIEMLSLLGLRVLVTHFPLYYQMKSFFRKFTQNPMILLMSASHLERIFNPEHYKNLEGGIFEGLGKLLDENTRLYIYPYKTEKSCLTASLFHSKAKTQKLFEHFLESGLIVDISGCENSEVFHHSEEVFQKIQKKDKSWEKMVPPGIVNYMQKNKLKLKED